MAEVELDTAQQFLAGSPTAHGQALVLDYILTEINLPIATVPRTPRLTSKIYKTGLPENNI